MHMLYVCVYDDVYWLLKETYGTKAKTSTRTTERPNEMNWFPLKLDKKKLSNFPSFSYTRWDVRLSVCLCVSVPFTTLFYLLKFFVSFRRFLFSSFPYISLFSFLFFSVQSLCYVWVYCRLSLLWCVFCVCCTQIKCNYVPWIFRVCSFVRTLARRVGSFNVFRRIDFGPIHLLARILNNRLNEGGKKKWTIPF